MEKLIRFHKATHDLPVRPEYWSKFSYAHCKEDIERRNIAETKHAPSKNMWYIRMCTLPIREDTTISKLVSLMKEVWSMFGIECFQISIERKKLLASFNFNFYDEKSRNHTIYLNRSEMNYMYVHVLRRIGLPIPLTPSLFRYYLLSVYKENSLTYTSLIDMLKKTSIGKADFDVLRICLMYVENNIKGIIK